MVPHKPTRADPLAAILGATGVILSTLHIPSQLGLDVDQTAAIGSAIVTIAASLRTWIERRRARQA